MTYPPPLHESGLLTVKEAATMIRMTPQWVYGAIDRGEFEGVIRNSPRSIRVPEKSVRDYLTRKTITPVSTVPA